ncbi:MAG TPA: hypothetical protein VFH11_03585 [Gemmatimonadota bacterium]|nr:hypothetical protein [Gemmatimonadota bacterium]
MFDRDSNGLIDLEVAFRDSLSGVDVASIRLTSDGSIKGPASSGANLMEHWRVVRADSSGFVVEETLNNLLARGSARLTVTVTDKVGNLASRQIPLDLPPAARHRIVDLQAIAKVNTGQITVGPDGTKAYVTTEEFGGSAISIVDLETLEVLKVVRSPIAALHETVVDPGRGRLYVTSIDESWVAVFDLASESFLPAIPTTFRGIGAAISFQRDKLYIGLELVDLESTGFISVVDLARGVEEEIISLGIPNEGDPDKRLTMDELAFGPGEDLLYATTSPFFANQGILVVDPEIGQLVAQIDLLPDDPQLLGGAHDLHVQGEHLIVTATVEVALVPLAFPEAIRFGSTGHPNLVPKELAIAPLGDEWAITTGDLGAGYREIQLMNAGSLAVIWRDRIPSTAVSPQGIAYRPDGNVFLVVGSRVDSPIGGFPAELTVYLYR